MHTAFSSLSGTGLQHFATDHIKPGQVVVLEGRHFQDFSAGDSGIVIRADAESQTCQVPRRLGFLRSARATVV